MENKTITMFATKGNFNVTLLQQAYAIMYIFQNKKNKEVLLRHTTLNGYCNSDTLYGSSTIQ